MSSSRRMLAVAAVGIAVGAVVSATVGSYFGSMADDPSKARVAKLETELARLQQQVAEDQEVGEVAQLKDQLTSIINSLESEPPAEHHHGAQSATDVRVQRSVAESDFEAIQEQQRLYDSNFRQVLEQGFTAADRNDVEWAQNTESEIENALINTKELARSKLLSAECRSTMCKIEIEPHVAQFQAGFESSSGDLAMYQNQLLISLADVLPTSALRVESKENGPRIIGYFARKGHSLPKPTLPSPGPSGVSPASN